MLFFVQNKYNKGLMPPAWLNWTLVVISLTFLAVFLLLPLVIIFTEAFRQGMTLWWQSISEPEALHALKLTLLTAAVAVPANTIFGLAAAWCLAKFRFFGRNIIITLIDLPFAVSPIIAGMLFVLLFGARGYLRGITDSLDLQIIFAVPGIILATMFITFPFVARELTGLMTQQGSQAEQAALSLGASGWQTFWHITLPDIKWGLLYGIILCNARAMGEFGAVSVVSGHIRGKTNTLPLHAEILYNEYNFSAAFAVASLLAFLALVTLVIKSIAERRKKR
ncbi:MAG: sulfate ABC transporter permease subunit CysW [Sedimentisphaerales bacterium]|nr:sulfate ABC transporter permease subunit CysW [Sedimentisphaerales bacterium]MBN2842390.1 sulfate ABC transporter permease subunit CysW [Sedimentisphaerales bacterium]